LWYGTNERKRVIEKLGLKSDSNVLDFGCGSGITTYEIAKRIPMGTVVAVDISIKQIERAEKRTEKLKLPNVIYIKEAKLKTQKNVFDAVSAVGVLEYVDNRKEIIRKLINSLKKEGRFSFLSFGKSFGVPAPDFLQSREEIMKLFSDTKCIVNIKIEKKKFTEYYYIWGVKK
jgi:cyclopropane fatty-acyl-phospholipid synthase-like methyltransferase